MGKCEMKNFFEHDKDELEGGEFFEESLNPL